MAKFSIIFILKTKCMTELLHGKKVPYMTLYKIWMFFFGDRKSKMTTNTGHVLTLDYIGK